MTDIGEWKRKTRVVCTYIASRYTEEFIITNIFFQFLLYFMLKTSTNGLQKETLNIFQCGLLMEQNRFFHNGFKCNNTK